MILLNINDETKYRNEKVYCEMFCNVLFSALVYGIICIALALIFEVADFGGVLQVNDLLSASHICIDNDVDISYAMVV